MRRIPAVTAAVVVAVGGTALGTGSAVAEPSKITCPDNMAPTPAVLVNNGQQKDKNGDQFVCAKPAGCSQIELCGGPDYDLFGAPLRHIDGNLYYVTDNL
jgi:hypothetical protein